MIRWLVSLSVCLTTVVWAESDDSLENSVDFFTELDGHSGLFDDIPVVMTPSKIVQPRADVSSSLSVLDGEFIRRINMQYVEDLLQFVPGFSVAAYKTSSQIVASYHGTEFDNYRRIQVLVNGRSVYSAGLARVEWATLPLSMEDVARVEINRGPNAASYGINSFFAVVNIITRSPLETLGNSISAYSGTNGDYRLYGQHSGLNGDWSYRASASTSYVDGFDEDGKGSQRHDGHSAEMGNVFLQRETATSFFDLDIGASYLKDNIEPSSYSRDSYDVNDPVTEVAREHIKLSYTEQVASNHELKLQYYYDQSESNEQHDVELREVFYETLFGVDVDDSVNASYNIDLLETRHDIELQSTWVASDKLRVISALGYRWDVAESEHYLSGRASNQTSRLSSNVEYRTDNNWVINAGAMLEHVENDERFLSPKLGATYKLSSQESIRLNVSKAVRTPDLSDQYFDWHYVLSNGDTSASTFAEEGEEEEKITSYEIGYYHYWPMQDLSFDLKFYHDDIQDMVLSAKQFTALNGVDTTIEEGVKTDVDINGVEVELDWRSQSGVMTRFTYAYQDTKTENKRLIKTTTPVLASFFYSLPVTKKWFYQGYYLYAKQLGGMDYKLFNTWFSYQAPLGGYSKATLGIGMEARLDDNALLSVHNNLAEDVYAYVFTNVTF